MANILLTAPMRGWACALDTVADAVFAEQMLGDGVAIDPTGDTLHAPCDAQVIAVQPTGHALTLRTDDGAELLIHIGLDTVALAGRGFSPCVSAGDWVAAGAPPIGVNLDLLVQEARAVFTPILVTNGDRFAIVDRAAGPVEIGAPLMTLVARDAVAATAPTTGERHTRRIVVPLAHGIHARPAARIAACAKEFDAEVELIHGDRSSNVRSPIGLLTLGVVHDATIIVAAEGPDAKRAVEAVATLILSGMGETAGVVPPPSPPPPPMPAAAAPVAGALAGVTAAPGLAVGPVGLLRATDLTVAEAGCGIAAEEDAFAGARGSLAAALTRRAAAAHGAERTILDAHAATLDAAGTDLATDLCIQGIDRVGGIDDPADALGEGEERDHLVPVPPQADGDGRVLLSPGAFLEGLQRRHASFGRRGMVDAAWRLCDELALLSGRKAHTVPDQMDDAGLHDGLGEDGVDRLLETLRPVDDGDQDVDDDAVLELVHDAQPELEPLVCSIQILSTSFVPSD